jgi:hypothetical protein
MRKLIWAAILVLVFTTPVCSQENSSESKLRRWYVGFQMVKTWRDNFDVFARPEWPPGQVNEVGKGGGMFFGYRFGDRFLLTGQTLVAKHTLPERTEEIYDVEALVTGTVLFWPRSFFQPLLRGGFGIAGESLTFDSIDDHIFTFGPSAIAGCGFQLRLGERMSLELEGVATFVNYLTVYDRRTSAGLPEESWKIRESNLGWRLGTSAVFWF